MASASNASRATETSSTAAGSAGTGSGSNTRPAVDITADLPNIAAPTLVMTSTNSGYYGTSKAFANWQRNIPDSELVLIPGDSYHISASYPDACAGKAAGCRPKEPPRQ